MLRLPPPQERSGAHRPRAPCAAPPRSHESLIQGSADHRRCCPRCGSAEARRRGTRAILVVRQRSGKLHRALLPKLPVPISEVWATLHEYVAEGAYRVLDTHLIRIHGRYVSVEYLVFYYFPEI